MKASHRKGFPCCPQPPVLLSLGTGLDASVCWALLVSQAVCQALQLQRGVADLGPHSINSHAPDPSLAGIPQSPGPGPQHYPAPGGLRPWACDSSTRSLPPKCLTRRADSASEAAQRLALKGHPRECRWWPITWGWRMLRDEQAFF